MVRCVFLLSVVSAALAGTSLLPEASIACPDTKYPTEFRTVPGLEHYCIRSFALIATDPLKVTYAACVDECAAVFPEVHPFSPGPISMWKAGSWNPGTKTPNTDFVVWTGYSIGDGTQYATNITLASRLYPAFNPQDNAAAFNGFWDNKEGTARTMKIKTSGTTPFPLRFEGKDYLKTNDADPTSSTTAACMCAVALMCTFECAGVGCPGTGHSSNSGLLAKGAAATCDANYSVVLNTGTKATCPDIPEYMGWECHPIPYVPPVVETIPVIPSDRASVENALANATNPQQIQQIATSSGMAFSSAPGASCNVVTCNFTAASATGSYIFKCVEGCNSIVTVARSNHGNLARARQAGDLARAAFVFCPQETRSAQRECFRQAHCDGLINIELDVCTLNGIPGECPQCTVDGSKKGLLGLLGLLGLIPLLLCSLLLCCLLLCIKRKKAEREVHLATFDGGAPNCTMPVVLDTASVYHQTHVGAPMGHY